MTIMPTKRNSSVLVLRKPKATRKEGSKPKKKYGGYATYKEYYQRAVVEPSDRLFELMGKTKKKSS